MKKLAFTAMLLQLFVLVFAQNKDSVVTTLALAKETVLKKESPFLLNIHAGYAFGLGSTFKFYPDNVSSVTVAQVGSSAPTKRTVYSSPTRGLGEGFRYGIGVSYIVNDFINLGIDLDYFKSTIYKNRDSSYSRTQITGAPNGMDSYTYTENTRISYDATLLTLSPNITFKAISKPKWYLYNKLGAVVTFRPNSTQNNVQMIATKTGWQGFFRDSAASNKQTYEWGIRNPAFGFMGGVGAQFRISKKWRAYGELQFSHIVFVVKKRTTTAFMINNQDVLQSLPISQRIIEFSTSYVDAQQSQDPDAPSKAITERIPITYLGFQAGLSYRF